MIITNVYGGLGNQMFQYAIARRIAYENNVEFKLDISKMKSYELRDFLLNSFNIKNDIATENEIANYKKIKNKYFTKLEKILHELGFPKFNKTYYEKQEFSFDQYITTLSDVYLEGYWQSPQYFDSIREIILNDFSLSIKLDKENQKILNQIQNTNSISLHIRRGDYVNNPYTNKIHGTCSLSYYQKAIEQINSKVSNPVYYIFSDDIDWVKANLKFDNVKIFVDINTGETCYFDMELMKNCKHNIIANSTFSWWGAWLNENENRLIIAPKKWINTHSFFDELLPKEWIKLENK